MSENQTSQRRVAYVAPEAKQLQQYARDICNDLAEEVDASLAHRDVVNGLAEFMRIAGRIQAKYLNRLASVDSPDEPEYGGNEPHTSQHATDDDHDHNR